MSEAVLFELVFLGETSAAPRLYAELKAHRPGNVGAWFP
jgi:hypothetical protein